MAKLWTRDKGDTMEVIEGLNGPVVARFYQYSGDRFQMVIESAVHPRQACTIAKDFRRFVVSRSDFYK